MIYETSGDKIGRHVGCTVELSVVLGGGRLTPTTSPSISFVVFCSRGLRNESVWVSDEISMFFSGHTTKELHASSRSRLWFHKSENLIFTDLVATLRFLVSEKKR